MKSVNSNIFSLCHVTSLWCASYHVTSHYHTFIDICAYHAQAMQHIMPLVIMLISWQVYHTHSILILRQLRIDVVHLIIIHTVSKVHID